MDHSVYGQPNVPWQRLVAPCPLDAAMPSRRCLHSPMQSPTMGKTVTHWSPYARGEVGAHETVSLATLEATSLDRKNRPWAA
jgi:hypothetical protein